MFVALEGIAVKLGLEEGGKLSVVFFVQGVQNILAHPRLRLKGWGRGLGPVHAPPLVFPQEREGPDLSVGRAGTGEEVALGGAEPKVPWAVQTAARRRGAARLSPSAPRLSSHREKSCGSISVPGLFCAR